MAIRVQSKIPYLYTILVVLLQLQVALSLTPPFACDASNTLSRGHAFCQASLPIEQRVEDLISRMNLDEKISQLIDNAAAIPRLGVPGYQWWSEALHGVSNWGHGMQFWAPGSTIHHATSFPQVLLTAASFNSDIWYRIGKAIGDEARALYNNGQAQGLTFWAPNVNIFRDPRWGRGQETPGEDPLTAGKYAAAFVKGVQGDSFQGGSSAPLKASACCKHFTAYDLDNWKGHTRYTFNAKVTAQDLEDTYNVPFKMCVEEGKASCLMCSYNQVNGVPTCADYNLLTKTARGSWGFNGYIVSDCDAVGLVHGAQGYARTDEDSVADVYKAGMDLDCGNTVSRHARSAVQLGKMSETDINRALKNLFTTRMRLGLFDGNPKLLANGAIAPQVVCSKEHQDLALEAAQNGIILLKNANNRLPLSRSTATSVGVIGPNADNPTLLIANYGGPACQITTPLQGLKAYAPNTRSVKGCDNAGCPYASVDQAVQLARSVDHVVMFMGLDLTQEKEGLDRVSLILPGMQQQLITSVAAAAKRPIILVLLSGGPIDISFAKNDNRIGAILWGGYPGQAGGKAIADVIFGAHNPGGRLPVTWYPQSFTNVDMTDMRMRADPSSGYPGRTYRFYTGQPVFKFGYGLSYTNYRYNFHRVSKTSLQLSQPLYQALVQQHQISDKTNYTTFSFQVSKIGAEGCRSLEFSATVGVRNSGPVPGRHPVMMFARWPATGNGRPVRQLVGFESLSLAAGEEKNVTFPVRPCEHLSRAHGNGVKVVDVGEHFLVVGKREEKISIVA